MANKEAKIEEKAQSGEVKKPEPIKVSVNFNTKDFSNVLEKIYNDGRLSGFGDGVKYIVTLTENFLVKHKKLPSRQALSESQNMPTWWIATLVEALYYEPPFVDSPPAKEGTKTKEGLPDELDESQTKEVKMRD